MVKVSSFGAQVRRELKKNWILYLMILPVVVYFLVDEYYPMYGVLVAFKDFKSKLGILGSPWVGFKHFKRLFSSYYFDDMLFNTLKLSFYSLAVGFTLPIVFALMLNYLRSTRLKKIIQMVSYAPHFLSTVIICSLLTLFCSKDTGIFNILGSMFGLERINILQEAKWFDDVYVWSGVWSGMGWNAIIYISALSGVDQSLHEAAIIDGATKMQRIWHVDLPSIKSTIVMLLILKLGSMMSVGFEKVFLLQNEMNYMNSITINTYAYEMGLVKGDYGFSAAVGLFNSVINVVLLVSANWFSKKVLDESLM